MKVAHRLSTVALIAAMSCAFERPALAAGTETKTDGEKQKEALLYRNEGSSGGISDYTINDAAAQVSAASMVGIQASAVTIAESTKDLVVFAQGLGQGESGMGIAYSPARINKPWLRVDLKDYLNGDIEARILAGLSFSYAQGHGAMGNGSYSRRAIAITTSGVFSIKDDPIYALATAVGKCGKQDMSD